MLSRIYSNHASREWLVAKLAASDCTQSRSYVSPTRVHKESAWAEQSSHDGQRLSNFWTPTQRTTEGARQPDGHDLLARAGFLRQSHSGIFHLLPLGLRVVNKIELLLDKHMQGLGASKVSLSSISSQDLWQRSGRFDKSQSSELFRLEDRKGTKYLLSPTHEEEITTIVANAVQSYKDLPLRLYQVSRKYRDEPRPRQGLLRGREFLMKDLYTFDATEHAAIQTYGDVRNAYTAFLKDLRVPYLTAAASSGSMGGNLSHEYHFVSPNGEDTIICCSTCELSMNEELYIGRFAPHAQQPESVFDGANLKREIFITKDKTKLCYVYFMDHHGEVNIYAVKAVFPQIDPSVRGAEALREFYETSNQRKGLATSMDSGFEHIEIFVDPRVPARVRQTLRPNSHDCQLSTPAVNSESIFMTKASNGDSCPACGDGTLYLQQAVEIGHTFFLGTRYTQPLTAQILDPTNKQINIQMGCHGIGVSRLVGAIASLLADKKGLNWPMAIAPFHVLIIPTSKIESSDISYVSQQLANVSGRVTGFDVAIDDREKPLGWKLNDADLVGYPFIVVLGNAWNQRNAVEVQCRRLGLKTEVPVAELAAKLFELENGL